MKTFFRPLSFFVPFFLSVCFETWPLGNLSIVRTILSLNVFNNILSIQLLHIFFLIGMLLQLFCVFPWSHVVQAKESVVVIHAVDLWSVSSSKIQTSFLLPIGSCIPSKNIFKMRLNQLLRIICLVVFTMRRTIAVFY